MKKQISKVLIFVLFVQAIAPIFFNVSYAADTVKKCEDNPPVCTATSPHMTTYLQFQKQMASFLSTNRLKTVQRQASEWEGWLFTSEILKINEDEPFDETLAWRALRIFDITATRTATSLITTVFLFELAAIWALADNTIWLTILFQDRPIVRDWTKLLDVEWWLSQTAYDLWVVWDIWKTIKNSEALDWIVKEYVGNWLFQEWAAFWSTTYQGIIRELAELNSAVKWFIAYDSKQLFESYNANNPNLKVSDDWVDALADEYKCVRRKFWFKCNTSWAALKKNLQIVTNNTNKQWKWSVKQIKDSYQDLKAALWNWTAVKDRIEGRDLTLSPREKEILRNRYWLNVNRLTKAQWSSIISLDTNLTSQWKKLAKWVNTAIEGVKRTINEQKKAYDEAYEEARAQDNKVKEARKIIKEMRKNAANNANVWKRMMIFYGRGTESWKESEEKNVWVILYIKDTLVSINQSKLNVDAVTTISNPIDLTNKYSVMLASVETLIDSIWDKESGLRMWLNKLCTKQCWNKWNDCCYVK